MPPRLILGAPEETVTIGRHGVRWVDRLTPLASRALGVADRWPSVVGVELPGVGFAWCSDRLAGGSEVPLFSSPACDYGLICRNEKPVSGLREVSV